MKFCNSIATLFPFLLLLSVDTLQVSTANENKGSSEESYYDEVLDDNEIAGSALDPHPDPNEENYEGMIYIGRHEEDGTRMGFDKNNGMVILNKSVLFN